LGCSFREEESSILGKNRLLRYREADMVDGGGRPKGNCYGGAWDNGKKHGSGRIETKKL